MTERPDKTTALGMRSWLDNKRAIIECLKRGDKRGLIQAMGSNSDEAAESLAELAIELRRENVAVIGAHDAFVRHTPAGSLLQVIKPVRLSLTEGTLYQIPSREQVNGTWRDVVKEPNKTQVSYQGLLRINAVAGCAVGLPPSVLVDGQERTNPYREVVDDELRRIVVAVNVIGPAPATGNPVIVQYTLDVDPAKDLQHMLMDLAKKSDLSAKVFLIDRDQWRDYSATMEPQDRYRWKFLPMFGGVGIAHDLRVFDVRKVYQKYVALLQNALKKALTVARRNAMKAHPALAFHSVVIANGAATVPAVGWASNTDGIDKYQAMMERLAHGLLPELDEGDVIELAEAYEPEQHHIGDGALDADVVEVDADAAAVLERNELIAQIDQGLELLTHAEISGLGYEPQAQTTDQLRDVLARLNALLDQGGAA